MGSFWSDTTDSLTNALGIKGQGVNDVLSAAVPNPSAGNVNNAADYAIKTQQDAANAAVNRTDSQLATATGYQQPYINAGKDALTKFQNQSPFDFANYGGAKQLGQNAGPTQIGGFSGTPAFDPNSVNPLQDPSFQFRLDQGLQGLQRSQVGKSLGGAAAREMMNYGQNMASGEYQNAYTRQLNAQKNNFDQSATGYGLNASSTNINNQNNLANFQANNAATTANNAANYQTWTGNAANQTNINSINNARYQTLMNGGLSAGQNLGALDLSAAATTGNFLTSAAAAEAKAKENAARLNAETLFGYTDIANKNISNSFQTVMGKMPGMGMGFGGGGG